MAYDFFTTSFDVEFRIRTADPPGIRKAGSSVSLLTSSVPRKDYSFFVLERSRIGGARLVVLS